MRLARTTAESVTSCFCRSGPWGFKSDPDCEMITAAVRQVASRPVPILCPGPAVAPPCPASPSLCPTCACHGEDVRCVTVMCGWPPGYLIWQLRGLVPLDVITDGER